MTQLQVQPHINSKKRGAKRAQLKIDMTPLVDLGFLLITFFIFTTSMSEPVVTKLYMPADGDGAKLVDDAALTVLLAGNDSVYYYQGAWEKAFQKQQVFLTNYDEKTGIGKIIRDKQKHLGIKGFQLMLLIKPLETSSYGNLMNSLDEALINNVKRYAIVNAIESEKNFISDRKN